MSLDSRGLSVLAYANEFTLWHYRSADAVAVVSEPSYFANAVDMIAGGDLVHVSAADGYALLYAMPTGRGGARRAAGGSPRIVVLQSYGGEADASVETSSDAQAAPRRLGPRLAGPAEF